MEVESVEINGKTYIELEQIDIDGVIYAYLSNKDDQEDFLIQKIVPKDGEVYYEGLEDKNEFDLALMHFAKKHNGVLEDN